MVTVYLNRRGVLKTAAEVAIGGGLAPYFWTAAAKAAQSPNDRLSIGAIGVGGRGSRLGMEIAGYGNMVACADVHRTHAEGFAAKCSKRCEVYGDYRELLGAKTSTS